MKINYFFLLIFLVFTSCIAVPKRSVVVKETFDAKKSIRVICVINDQNQTLSMTEHFLSREGFVVMPEGQLRSNVVSNPYATYAVSVVDSAFHSPSRILASVQMFSDVPADYVLKIDAENTASFAGPAYHTFSGILINTKTGKVEASYHFRQSHWAIFKRTARSTLSEMIRELR